MDLSLVDLFVVLLCIKGKGEANESKDTVEGYQGTGKGYEG